MRISNRRWIALVAVVCAVVVAAAFGSERAMAVPGSVIVSAQNDCSVGPTNDNSLQANQTAYVWLVFNGATAVKNYTYQITGTSNPFDSGILKIRFTACRKVNLDDYVAKFRVPATAGGYQLTVFDETGTKVSSDNFTVN